MLRQPSIAKMKLTSRRKKPESIFVAFPTELFVKNVAIKMVNPKTKKNSPIAIWD